MKNIIPSREWLLGWFTGYETAMSKNTEYYPVKDLQDKSRQWLWNFYKRINLSSRQPIKGV